MTEIRQLEIAVPESLSGFQMTLLKITLRAKERIELPSFAGSSFRGAFGAMFRRIACAPHCQEVKTCLVASECPYARIFEAVPKVDSYRPTAEGGLPKPFIIHPPATKRSGDHYIVNSGDSFYFHMALVGFASNYLPYFILTWRELGREGIGRGRGRFQLERVESCLSFERDEKGTVGREPVAALTGIANDNKQIIYSSTDELVQNRQEILTASRLLATNPRIHRAGYHKDDIGDISETQRLAVDLITPMRLKSGEEFLRSRLPFDVLIGALLRRLESLSFFYCGGSLNLDYRGLIVEAKNIRQKAGSLQWVKWERYSKRQDSRIPWGGLLGSVEYSGDARRFLPFLALGEIVGVGNNCAFGLGRFSYHF